MGRTEAPPYAALISPSSREEAWPSRRRKLCVRAHDWGGPHLLATTQEWPKGSRFPKAPLCCPHPGAQLCWESLTRGEASICKAIIWSRNRGWRASLVAQTVKNPPAVQETWVWSLGQEDPLKKGTATHSSVLDWRIPRTEEPGRLPLHGVAKVEHDWAPNTLTFFNRGWHSDLVTTGFKGHKTGSS